MKLTGKFTSIDDVQYTVELITNNSATPEKTVKLGANPFTVQMKSSNMVYTPVKSTGATIQLYTNEIDLGIYSGKAKYTKVTLKKGTDILWIGYLTPCKYDMPFDNDYDYIDLEAVDGLSVLKYAIYDETKDNIAFNTLLHKILKLAGCYRYMYISDNVQLTANGTSSIINSLFINNRNFFDKKDDDNTSDEDVAWNCLTVLEEVCKFLGYVCIAEGEDVYIIDYDAIKRGRNTYYRYDLRDSTAGNGTRVTLSYTHNITFSDMASTGNSYSLDKVYNKVTVKADYYEMSSATSDLYKSAKNITKSSDPDVENTNKINSAAIYGEIVGSASGGYMECFIGAHQHDGFQFGNWIFAPDKILKYSGNFVKYMKNDDYTLYQYSKDKNPETYPTEINYSDIKEKYGAYLCEFSHTPLDVNYNDVKTFMDKWKAASTKKEARDMFDNWLKDKGMTNVSLHKCIMLLNPDTKSDGSGHITRDNVTKYPYLKTKLGITAAMNGENTYFLIKGSYNFHTYSGCNFPLNNDEFVWVEYDGRPEQDFFCNYEKEETHLVAKLKWGNYSWNGESWVYGDKTFEIKYFDVTGNNSETKIGNTAGTDIPYLNDVTWRIGINEKGLLIPTPDVTVTGEPEFTLYAPVSPQYWWRRHKTWFRKTKYYKEGNYWNHNVVFLRDFNIKMIITDPAASDDKNDNQIYSNVIDVDNVSKMSDIKMKINTFNGKKLSYSIVMTNGDEKVDTTYNIALKSSEAAEGLTACKQEEHLIFKLVNQYSTPANIIDLNVDCDIKCYGKYTDPVISGDFILNSYSIDYRNNIKKIKLIEKK